MGRSQLVQQVSKAAAAYQRLQICRGQHKFSLAKLRGSNSAAVQQEDQRAHTADSYNPHLQLQQHELEYAWTPSASAASHDQIISSCWKPDQSSRGLWSPDHHQLKQQSSSASAAHSVAEDVHLYHQCDHSNDIHI